MRMPSRPLAIAVTLPFLAGCFGVAQAPLPPEPERALTPIRGVVVRSPDGEEDERVQFADVLDVEWRQRTLFVLGSLASGASPTSQEWAYDDLSGVLTRQIDVNRTSLLISALIVGTVSTIAVLVTGQTNERTRIEG